MNERLLPTRSFVPRRPALFLGFRRRTTRGERRRRRLYWKSVIVQRARRILARVR